MKVTKRPKHVTVIHKPLKVTITISAYQCPTCKGYFASDGPPKRVTRFVCDCGQELIVKHVDQDKR